VALVAVLCLAIAAAYAPATTHGFVEWDDGPYIKTNPRVRDGLTPEGVRWAFTTFHMGNWHPLTWLSHMLDCEWFGLHAGPHHAVSIALHAATAALLFLALRRMTGAFWRPAVVAALFALHPLRVESVAWAAERKDVLAGLFWMATLLAYAAYAERGGARRYAAVVATLILGLLAKPMAVTLPFVLLLLDFWPLGRWRRGAAGHLVAEKLPLVALVALAGWVAILAQRAAGAVATLDVLPFGERLGNALVSYGVYLRMIVWPAGLAFYYPHPMLTGEGGAREAAVAALFLGAVSAAVLATLRRGPWLAVGWLWYLGTLVPVIGLVQLGMQARADRYTYLPSVGIALAAVWGLGRLAEAVPHGRRTLVVVVVVAVVASALATRAQVGHWRDNRSLAERALAMTESNYKAHDLLGVALEREGQDQQAAAEFRTALELHPGCTECLVNLALVVGKLGRLDESRALFEQALARRNGAEDPRCLNGLGAVLQRAGDLEAAERQLRRAVELAPEFAEAHHNLGVVYGLSGRLDAARAELEQALDLAPDYAMAEENLGVILHRLGDLEGAAQRLERAVELRPESPQAHFRLALVRAAQGLSVEAAAAFERVLALEPDRAEAHHNLAVLLRGLGQTERAEAHFERAGALDPRLTPPP
jgi:Flp pilus assembly protein TadD